MQEPLEAYKFAGDVTKQVITLSTAVVSLVVGLANLGKGGTIPSRRLLAALALTFVASVVFGLLTLLAVTGCIAKACSDGVYSFGIVLFAMLQEISFVLGLLLSVWFGIDIAAARNAPSSSPSPSPSPAARPSYRSWLTRYRHPTERRGGTGD